MRIAGTSPALLWSTALAAVLGLTLLPSASAAQDIPDTERVSTGGDGTQRAFPAEDGTVSADGRYVAFESRGSDPACPDVYYTCVYVKDLETGQLARVPDTKLYTSGATLSADGSRLAYSSGNRYPMPYVHDRATGETQLLWPAEPPDSAFYELGSALALSADGRHVAYSIGNRHGYDYGRVLYVRDLDTGTDERISPLPPEGMIDRASLSADGRTVAYSVVVPGDQGATVRIYVHDRDSGATRRVDPDAGGSSVLAQLSADGRSVLFTSTSADGTSRAYRRDLRTDRLRPVGPEGARADAADGTGRYVLLSEGDALVLLDLRTGKQHTVAASGTAGPGSVTRHGRDVVFASTADDLVPDDTNGMADLFIHHTH